MFPWQTSVLGTLVGLICAQNTTNSFSAVMYNNLITLEPNSTGLEPNWDKLRQRDPLTLQNALSCGPFYRLKSKMIIKLLGQVFAQFGTTSLEVLEDRNVWNNTKVRTLLLSYTGIGVKTTSCMMLYRLRRLSFAVDTNILKIGARLGWFVSIGVHPSEALPKERKSQATSEAMAAKRRKKYLATHRAQHNSSASSASSANSASLESLLVAPHHDSTTRQDTLPTSSSAHLSLSDLLEQVGSSCLPLVPKQLED